MAIALSLLGLVLIGSVVLFSAPGQTLAVDLGTSATAHLRVGRSSYVSGELKVQQSYPACADQGGCVWNLAAISAARGRSCSPTTRSQAWVSDDFSSAGERTVPISLAPERRGSGAICLYVDMATAQGDTQGLVGIYRYTVPRIRGRARITLGPQRNSLGGRVKVTEYGCKSDLCTWATELLVVRGSRCPAHRTIRTLDWRASWAAEGVPHGRRQTLVSNYYAAVAASLRQPATVSACVYIGVARHRAAHLIKQRRYHYLGELNNARAAAASVRALHRRLGRRARVTRISCLQHSVSRARCRFTATRRRRHFNGTVTVLQAVFAAHRRSRVRFYG